MLNRGYAVSEPNKWTKILHPDLNSLESYRCCFVLLFKFKIWKEMVIFIEVVVFCISAWKISMSLRCKFEKNMSCRWFTFVYSTRINAFLAFSLNLGIPGRKCRKEWSLSIRFCCILFKPWQACHTFLFDHFNLFKRNVNFFYM